MGLTQFFLMNARCHSSRFIALLGICPSEALSIEYEFKKRSNKLVLKQKKGQKHHSSYCSGEGCLREFRVK